MMNPLNVWLGLGANLGNAEHTLQRAVADLCQLPDSELHALSSLYRSAPLGPAGQPDYLNAVAGLRTTLPPHTLLSALQGIENAHGRERLIRWGARTLDLDILLYADDLILTPDLTVPHREMENRNFVIIPLLEIWPDARLPDGRLIRHFSMANDATGLEPLRQGHAWGKCTLTARD